MTTFGIVLALVIAAYVLVNVKPAALARFIRNLWPITLIVAGSGLAFVGRFGLALPLIGFGIAGWLRNRKVTRMSGASAGVGTSSVRSAAFEMTLDHETGDMNGEVLFGDFEGQFFDDLDEQELTGLFEQLGEDGESGALLEAYLDRRFSTWRENTDRDTGAGQGGSARSGPMTHEEAYEVLGLEPGAGIDEIRQSHRRLMKGLHPDSGGSTFLASKINEAKDILMRGH